MNNYQDPQIAIQGWHAITQAASAASATADRHGPADDEHAYPSLHNVKACDPRNGTP